LHDGGAGGKVGYVPIDTILPIRKVVV